MTERSTGTVYRTSKPSIASVGPNGLVTAHRPGTVFLTATNFSATAVARVDVVNNTVATTVAGLVQLSDGTAVAGANVSISQPAATYVVPGRIVLRSLGNLHRV